MIPFIERVKQSYPNAVVLVKVDDYFWAYEADADVLHKVLGSKIYYHQLGRRAGVYYEKKAAQALMREGYDSVVYDNGKVYRLYESEKTNVFGGMNSWQNNTFVPKPLSSRQSKKEIEAESERQRQAEKSYQQFVAVNNLPETSVRLNSVVTVRIDGEVSVYKIVKPGEEKPFDGLISYESPIGEALIGHWVGNTVIAHAPAGDIAIEIVAFDNDEKTNLQSENDTDTIITEMTKRYPDAIIKESDIDYAAYLSAQQETPDMAIVMESGSMYGGWYDEMNERYVVCGEGAELIYNKKNVITDHNKLFIDPSGYYWVCGPFKYKLLEKLRNNGMKARLVDEHGHRF